MPHPEAGDKRERSDEASPGPHSKRPRQAAVLSDEEVERLKLRPFVPHTLPYSFLGMLVGKCGTGKSFWLRWLMYNLMYRFARTHVFSGTAFNGFYQEFVDERDVGDGYDEERMQRIMEAAQRRKDWEDEHGVDLEFRVLVIFDDLFQDMNVIRNSAALRKLFTKHRHLNISVVVLSQAKVGLAKYQREQNSFVGMFKTASLLAKDGLYQDFGDMTTKNQFVSLLHRVACKRFLLVVRPSRNSRHFHRVYESSIAEATPPFRMPRLRWDGLNDGEDADEKKPPGEDEPEPKKVTR